MFQCLLQIVTIKRKVIMNINKNFSGVFLVVIGLLFSTSLWAHGGAAGTDTDQ